MSFTIINDAINTLIQSSWLDIKNLAPLWMIVILCEISTRFGASIVFRIILRGVTSILEFWLLMISIVYFWGAVNTIFFWLMCITLLIITILWTINIFKDKKDKN